MFVYQTRIQPMIDSQKSKVYQITVMNAIPHSLLFSCQSFRFPPNFLKPNLNLDFDLVCGVDDFG